MKAEPSFEQIAALLAQSDIDVSATLDAAKRNFPNGRRPDFWGDYEVRAALVILHREITIAQARSFLAQRFGEQRASSSSAIHRFWKVLDKVDRRRRRAG